MTALPKIENIYLMLQYMTRQNSRQTYVLIFRSLGRHRRLKIIRDRDLRFSKTTNTGKFRLTNRHQSTSDFAKSSPVYSADSRAFRIPKSCRGPGSAGIPQKSPTEIAVPEREIGGTNFRNRSTRLSDLNQ